MQYKLVACDMDGTALTTDKRLTKNDRSDGEGALRRKARDFSTGRNLSIVRPYMKMVQGMRYAVTSAGAAVNDIEIGGILSETTIEAETVKWIISAAVGVDTLPVVYIGNTACRPIWASERAGSFMCRNLPRCMAAICVTRKMYLNFSWKIPCRCKR